MEDKKEEKGMCGSESHCGFDHKKHHLAKKFFMLLVLVVVFSMGVQLGELKGELRASRGGESRGNMMRSYGYDNDNNYGPRMMGGYSQNLNTWATPVSPTTITPVIPSIPAKQ